MTTPADPSSGVGSDVPEPPSPPSHPLIGHTHQFFRANPLEWFTGLSESYGDVVRLRVAGQSIVLLSNPADIERVLVTNNQNYRKGSFQKLVTSSLLGNGLVLAEGDEWRAHRRGLEPAFHPDRMPGYARRIRSHTERLLNSWSSGDVIDLEEEMKRLTLRIIADALFGVDLTEDATELGTAFTRILEHFERISQTYVYLPEWIPTPENVRYRRALDTLEAAVQEIIDAHRTGEIGRRTVVSYLLENEGGWSEDEMRDEIVTLLVAGHETTALALTFTGYLLGRNPGVAGRVTSAVRGLDNDGIVDGVAECVELDRVVKESLRLYPPVYGIFREPIEDDVLGGYRIPSGSILALNQWVVHRDDRFFDQPDEFRPDRWTEEFEDSLSPGAYFPFAAGPRRCLGDRFALLEAKLILAMILREYQFELVSEVPLEVVPSLTTQPKHPIRIRLN
ncbi:cytochrome P450 [Haloterrigena sp. H1]|uniref:cytochrome P450 n=1 Tax=Haloterrigena sp. H1 TaxID=2552943 RepID=UPI00110EFFBE|nr:cytochrome P450 [Haloterrigena sp. H1]TMT80226.1 cytochrome P450 [Haloterrigena sp. H1]